VKDWSGDARWADKNRRTLELQMGIKKIKRSRKKED
jgi:hypothetical protein